MSDKKAWPMDLSEVAKQLCDGEQGPKADGAVFISEALDLDFRWDFFNRDGSRAEMCGNAARCAAQFYFDRLSFKKTTICFGTDFGIIRATKSAEASFQVALPALKDLGQRMKSKNLKELLFYIDSGVPHVVLEGKPNTELATLIRFEKEVFSRGTNVTFVEKTGELKVKAVTFERGVEDYTQACGTGAIAAAAWLAEKSEILGNDFEVQMPGGLLKVRFQKNETGIYPELTGPVEKIFEFWKE